MDLVQIGTVCTIQMSAMYLSTTFVSINSLHNMYVNGVRWLGNRASNQNVAGSIPFCAK